MYKVAICDDDKYYVEKLKKMVIELSAENLSVYEYYSGEALLHEVGLHHELIILDVQLKGISGTATARQLRQVNKSGILAFCSGVQNPTTESFKMSPYRYIMKQFPDYRIKDDLQEILFHMKQVFGKQYIAVSDKNVTFRVNVHDILYISKLKRGSLLHIVAAEQDKYGENLKSAEHLDDIYTALDDYGFEYAHDSYIINCNWVEQFTRGLVTLEGGEVLTISRSKYETFKMRMIEFWGNKYDRSGNA